MTALAVTSAAVIIAALGYGGYRLAFWRGVTGNPPAGRIRHISNAPGFELSAYENALRAFAFWRAHHHDSDPSQP
jgi:hypothetical protein